MPGPASTLHHPCSKGHPLPPASLGPYGVRASFSSPQNPFPHHPHLVGTGGAVPSQGSHPAAGGEGTTEGLSPRLAPHLRDPGHPKPVGEHHISLSPPPQREHTPGACPCLPANGEDGHLAGMSSGFGDFGGTERWQHLGPLLATAGTRGRSLHRVQVLLVVAGGGKLRQEVQPGEGGNAISLGVVPP